jgi:23S rRNA pseudouridine2605 synthase
LTAGFSSKKNLTHNASDLSTRKHLLCFLFSIGMKTNEPRREGANFKKSGSGSKPTGSKPTRSKPTGSKPAKLSPAGRPLKGKPKPRTYTPRPEASADRPDRGPRNDGPREERAPRPYNNDRGPRNDGPREERSNDRTSRPFNQDARPFNQDARPFNQDARPFNREDRPFNRENRPYNREEQGDYGTERRNSAYTKPQSAYKGGRPVTGNPAKRWHAPTVKTAETHGLTDGEIRLNRFLARAGVCSRRDADKLIADGMVMVNGEVVLEMGHKVMPSDEVRYAGEVLKSEKKMYLVLNKPKGFITSMDDEKARKTVMELIRGACRERIYPVGRLDRATTGVLLFTNDGDMAKKLTHPSHGAKKIYSVSLDKPLSKAHFAELAQGIELEDGPIKADEISQVEAQDAREIGVSLHSGRNRIVRRMFEHLGYEVVRLDRVQFGPITKKNLARGHYRLLNDKEIAFLKMLG